MCLDRTCVVLSFRPVQVYLCARRTMDLCDSFGRWAAGAQREDLGFSSLPRYVVLQTSYLYIYIYIYTYIQ